MSPIYETQVFTLISIFRNVCLGSLQKDFIQSITQSIDK
jgi:hypothetical protein